MSSRVLEHKAPKYHDNNCYLICKFIGIKRENEFMKLITVQLIYAKYLYVTYMKLLYFYCSNYMVSAG